MGGRLHTMDFASLDAAPDGQVVKKIAGLWVAADEGGADYESRTEYDQSNDGDTVAAGVLNVISNATNAVFGLKLPATAGLAIGTKIYFQIDTIDPYYVVVSTEDRLGAGDEAIIGDGNELGQYHIVAGAQGDFQVFEYIGAVQGSNTWLVGERSWSQASSHKQPVDLATVAALPAYSAMGSDENEILTASGNGELVVDGVTVGLATDPWRGGVLLRHGSDGSDNKLYQVVDPGDGSNPWILRPRADWRFEQHTKRGAEISVTGGNTLAGAVFMTTADKLVGGHGNLNDWVLNRPSGDLGNEGPLSDDQTGSTTGTATDVLFSINTQDSSTTLRARVSVIGQDTQDNKMQNYEIVVTIKRDSVDTVTVEQVDVISVLENQAPPTDAVTFVINGNDIDVTVLGITGRTIDWRGMHSTHFLTVP